MKETFETNLADAQKEEASSVKAYEELKAAKEAEIAAGQAQIKAGSAAQGIGSLGAREGGGSCCMMEFVRRQ